MVVVPVSRIYTTSKLISQAHADLVKFATDVSKEAAYKQVLEQVTGLMIDQRNWVTYLSARLPPPVC